jgi:leader peptidase (prepilin peptidase) / N-methyltransferase
MLAYRLISGDSLLRPRSFCPVCNTSIAWYDLIPLFSWLLLKGKCRTCLAPISWLYFFIELITVIVFTLLFLLVPKAYWLAYSAFFSALLVTIRTDLEFMLISRYASIFLIPLGLFFSYYHYTEISFIKSILGMLTAYCFLRFISILFLKLTKKEGMGEGDAELLAFIGSFIGITGWWVSLIVGSLAGSLYGIGYLLWTQKKSSVKIPFGPFLALGAFMFVLFQDQLLWLFGF